MAKLEDIMLEKNMARCEKCGGRLLYKYSGIYECEGCHIEVYDDFGRVKKYIEDHGPAPANEISQNTGVGLSTINKFLRAGRVEIPEGSGFYIKCAICGAPIRYGKYCMECAVKSASGERKGVFMEEAGERVRENASKMHYLGDLENDSDDSKRKRRMSGLGGSSRSGRTLNLNEESASHGSGRRLDLNEDTSHHSGRRLDLNTEESGISKSGRRLETK